MMKLDVYGGGAAGRGQLKLRGARRALLFSPIVLQIACTAIAAVTVRRSVDLAISTTLGGVDPLALVRAV